MSSMGSDQMTYSVPNSLGSMAPKLLVPENACDSHIHIYSKGFKYSGSFVEDVGVEEYQKFQERIGTSRTVVVNPRICGTDNAVTLDAIEKLGIANTRGIAVVGEDVSSQELERLHLGGMRGVRFTLHSLEGAPTSFDMVEKVANRIKEFGWHLQLHWTAEQFVEHRSLLDRLKCPIVFDHLGRIAADQLHSEAHQLIIDFLKSGNAWLKLSGAYLNSEKAADNYSDIAELARSCVQTAPDRVVWGSDWPHPTEMPPKQKPDDAQLIDLLNIWAPSSELQKKILVDNPNNLYFK
jgi:predicted TIM-barrel fold metal-dependent hydrolase